MPLILRADGRTPHQAVVTVLDVAGQLGLQATDHRHGERAGRRAYAADSTTLAGSRTMTCLDRYGYSLNRGRGAAVAAEPAVRAGGAGAATDCTASACFRSEAVGVPLIVVGNISVGGTGKTPLVARLVELLREAGYKPGVISRGYGGQSAQWPRQVTADSDPREVGDEPVLLARRCRCPIVVGPDRVAAARALFDTYGCNVILSDDGLQHYRLQRDLEIAVVDGFRRLGNGACLPAGPLREPPSRLREVDFVVGNGAARGDEYLMSLRGDRRSI